MKQPLKNHEELVRDWRHRVLEAQGTHYECAKPLDRMNIWCGIPVVALSTIVGTSVFASLGESNPDLRWRIVVGLISVLAAVLSGLQTFLRFSERAEKHRSVAARYGAIRREIEQVMASGEFNGPNGKKILDPLRAKMDALAAEAPATPQRIYKAVAARLDASA
jgi:hypothetical protein